MLTDAALARIRPLLPFLNMGGPDLARAFAQDASLRRLSAGTQVFMEGDECGTIAILVDGAARVYKIGETGREITLYRFERGESCILTAIAVLILTGTVQGLLAVILGVLAAAFLVTSLISTCPLYSLFGIITCPRKAS